MNWCENLVIKSVLYSKSSEKEKENSVLITACREIRIELASKQQIEMSSKINSSILIL